MLQDNGAPQENSTSPAKMNPILKASILQRMELYGVITVLGGIPLQVGIMIFLGYLWFQQHLIDDYSHVWRIIVLSSWMAPTVTLSTVILRLVVGAQLVVCTCLVAGLMLETASTSFQDAPKLAVLRAYNGGPWDIVWLIIQRLPHRFCLSRPELLIILLSLTGVALQFSSTFLVSDLGESTIKSDPESRRLAVFDTSGKFVTANGDYLWTKSPGTWSTFAEVRADNASVSSQASDTGTILRAYLPFEAKDRLLLRSYQGPAVTQQARTVCVPAELDGQFSFWGGTDQLAVTANVSAPMGAFYRAGFQFINAREIKTKPGPWPLSEAFDTKETMSRVPFSCPMFSETSSPVGVKGERLSGVRAICSIGDRGLERFVLIDLAGTYNDWYRLHSTSPFTYNFKTVLRRGPNENGWATYTSNRTVSSGSNTTLQMKASVCGFRYNHTTSTVSASTSSRPIELDLQRDNVANRWNTDDILRLLGAIGNQTDATSRGTFRLTSPYPPRDVLLTIPSTGSSHRSDTPGAMSKAFDKGIVNNGTWPQFASWNDSMVFCTRCFLFTANGLSGGDTVHPSNVLLMEAALNATNNPALALDVLWASWTQTLYSNVVGQFDGLGSENSTMVWARTVLAPRRFVGYFAVLGLLVGHITLMMVVTVYFALGTTSSFSGGVWQAIAQAASADQVKEVLDDVRALPDAKIDQLIKSRGLDKARMRLETDVTGNVRLVTKQAER